MLSIILKILSILGIILLVLLGLILLILLLVLFFPICYRIKADKRMAPNNNQNSEASASEQLIKADAKAWWLFGLLRARYQYPAPGTLKVKFLFFTIYDSGTDSNNDSNTDSTEDWEPEAKSDFTDKASDADKKRNNTQTDSSDQSDSQKQTVASSDNTVSDNSSKTPADDKVLQEEQPVFSNSNLFDKIQYTIKKLYDKIKKVFTKIKEICDNIAYYKEILSEEDTKVLLKHALMRLGKILKSLRPRKLRANICYGADSPDTTGYVCAFYGMIAHHLGKHVIFTPDFEKEIFEGNVYAAGHTTVFLILWNLLMILKDKRLWELRDKLNKEI